MRRWLGTGGLLVVVAMLVGACGGSTPASIASAVSTSPAPGATPPAIGSSAHASQPASPSPLSAPAGLPAPLVSRWVGETRSIPGLVPPAVESFLQLDRLRMEFLPSEDWDSPILVSAASSVGTDGVQLRLETDLVGCRSGTEGTYTFSLSPSGRSLAIRVVEDPCAARSAAVSGTWTRIGCPDNHSCLGDLDAGEHVSVIYTPFVRFADWRYDYGRFGYTTPEGWSNPEDDQDGYVLVRQDAPEGAGIFVFSDVLAHAEGIDPATGHCRSGRASGVGSSAVAIYRWIRSLPGLRTSHEEDVTVGGLWGWSVDVAVDPAWKGTCGSPGEKPGVPLFVNAQSTPDEGFDWGISGAGRMRLYVLELGPGRTLLIDIEAQDKAAWDALLPEAGPIVDSFELRH